MGGGATPRGEGGPASPQSPAGLLSPAGRVVMVSGASRGLGAAIARRLQADGFFLSIGVRDPARVATGGGPAPDEQVLHQRYDATEPATADRWVEDTLRRFGRLDGLVNNAGIHRHVTLDEGAEESLDELWQVNVKGPFRLLRLALPHLKASGQGRVVNVASTDAKRYRDATVSVGYAMSKHALLALSHAAKFAGWEHGVRVTALCPGAIDTELVAGLAGVTPRANRLSPETVAEIVSLLLRLPNTATIAELVVNTRLEPTL
jgi:NAD(P)-dependent dehydrogenase (short-subunit alcohol dehydrogenase family)